MQALCSMQQSLYVCMCTGSAVYRRLCYFQVSSILSGSYTLSVSSSAEFSKAWGERFDGDILFRTECSMSLITCTLFDCESLFCFHHRRKKFVTNEQDPDLWDIRMPLGVFLLLFCIGRTAVFSFPQIPGLSSLRLLAPKQCQGWFISWIGPSVQSDWSVTPTRFVSLLP